MSGAGVLLVPVIGLLSGALVGASAIGSGSLVLPLLLLLTPLPADAAVGTSLALAAGTKLVGYLAHRQMAQVNGGLGWRLVASALPGSVAAALLLRAWPGASLPAAYVRQAIGMLLVALAILLLLVARRTSIPAGLGGDTIHSHRSALVVGATVSFLVTLTSVGSGSLLMLFLLLWRPAWHGELVGTATFYGLVLAWFGTLAHLALHNVDFRLLAQLAAGSVPGVLVGARLPRWIPERSYQLGIAGLNLALGLRLACSA